jgi:hypothetical protein
LPSVPPPPLDDGMSSSFPPVIPFNMLQRQHSCRRVVPVRQRQAIVLTEVVCVVVFSNNPDIKRNYGS